jgi:hypothetical protein
MGRWKSHDTSSLLKVADTNPYHNSSIIFRAGGRTRSNYLFLTLKERDDETRLDYFEAR